MAKRNIQREIETCSGKLVLDPGEYEGPVVIRRPCVIDGNGATLWAQTGPVLSIASPNVTIRNLRVEITGSAGGEVAIKATDPPTLEHVSVHGAVEGVPGEAPVWDMPPVLNLGDFAPGAVNTFVRELVAPMDAILECRVRDVSIEPTYLRAGRNPLYIRIAPMRDNTIVYGEILVKSAVTRRICLLGKAIAGAAHQQASRPELLPPPPPKPENKPATKSPRDHETQNSATRSAQTATNAEQNGQHGPKSVQNVDEVRELRKGSRLGIDDLAGKTLEISYVAKPASRKLDLDAYVFLLEDDKKAAKDEDLVFFSNPESQEGGVSVTMAGGMPVAKVVVGKASKRIDRIVVCFSVYGDNVADVFSTQKDARIDIAVDGKRAFVLPLSGLGMEKTLTAVELYRYKGGWRMQCVGACYKGGLVALCNSYGLEVE